MEEAVILNPTGQPRETEYRQVPRPDDLTGLRLGLLDNGKPNGDVILKELGALLSERYALKSVSYLNRRGPGVDWWARKPQGSDDFIDRTVEQSDFAIVAVGD